MQSKAKTVNEFLESLDEDRRYQIQKVREVILENLPDGYEEVMNWGMITYQVPLERYPDTYNKQPSMYAALAFQKNHMAVYLMGIYSIEKLRKEFENNYKASGKKMDIGKSCVRFKKIENLPLDLVGKAIAAVEVETYIDIVKKAHEKLKV